MIKKWLKKILYDISEKASLRRKMNIRGKATPMSVEEYYLLIKTGKI